MTLESTSFVAKESFSDRFEYLVRCGDLMLPLSDAEGQDSAVSEFKAKIKDESHEVTVLPPVVLGLGFAKLRHKLAALLHQFRLELGNDLDVIQAYCRSVLSICTDQGTEAGIFSVPSIDIHKHLINEAKALSSACPPGVLWALKDLVPAPGSGGHLQVGSGGDQLLPSDNDPGPVPSENVHARLPGGNDDVDQLHFAASLVCRLFPNALYIPGIKHSMDNCLHDVWGFLRARDLFLKQLGAIEYLMKQPMLRSKLAFVFFNEATTFDKTFSQLLKHWGPTLQSLRWHAVIEFLQSLLKLEEGLRKKWNLERWMKSLPSDRKEQGGKAECSLRSATN